MESMVPEQTHKKQVTFAGRFSACRVPLNKRHLIMLHNFSYVACEDKVLLYAYQIFEIINNQINKINLLVIVISTR